MCKASSYFICPVFQPVAALLRVLQSERQALASELAATKKDLSAAQHRLEHTEGNHRDASSELTALRTQLQELQVANATLQQEVKIKDGLHQHATEMLESESTKTVSWRWCACVARGLCATAGQAAVDRAVVCRMVPHQTSLEETLAMFKSGNAQYREKLEECRAELKKGNSIIARLQDKVRSQKGKLRQREAVLIRQEELIEEKERALFALRQQLAEAQDRASDADRTAADLRGKLKASAKEHAAAQREVEALNAVRATCAGGVLPPTAPLTVVWCASRRCRTSMTE